MKRILSLFFATLLLAPLAALYAAEAPNSANRPNIVVFLVDDMGWQDTSVPFYTERTKFNDHYRTPNMELLAAQGVKFTRAYAAPVCSPTRTAIMTGQSPARHHVTNWTLYPDKDTSGSTKRLSAPAWKMGGLQPGDTPTLPQLLHAAGYMTIHCGKWHIGAEGTAGSDPCKMGFDVNIAGHAAGAPASYLSEDNYGNKPGAKNVWAVPGLDKYFGSGTHLTDALTIEASSALETAVKSKKPFFLYMAHYVVHVPIQPHKQYLNNYQGKTFPGTKVKIDKTEADYASMVEGMDASLGAILKKLNELGVAESAIILFASDNGGLAAHARGPTPYGGHDTQNWPLREGKGSAYEGGTRVPLIVAWAKPNDNSALQQSIAVRHAAECDRPVISEDYFPTVLRWAGVKASAAKIDGRDFTALLGAAAPNDRPRPIISHYPHVWGPSGPGYQPFTEIRLGDWKAIYFFQPQRWELYNLADDLREEHDLAALQPAKLRELALQLRDELQLRGAQFPIDKATHEPEAPKWP